MAKAAAMLPPDLSEIAQPLRDGDELLTTEELRQVSLFDELKKAPSFDRFPGFTVLRRCSPGRVICEQGDAGATAFAILTSDDVLGIRRRQLETLEAMIAGKEVEHQYFQQLIPVERAVLKGQLEAEIAELETRCRQLEDADPSIRREVEHVAEAQLVVSLEVARRSRGLAGWLNRVFRGRREATAQSRPRLIPVDGPSDIDSNTRRAPLYEGELFGEMSCMNRSPRSATVVATAECFLLEMVRNVLDTLHSDATYKERMDVVYRERVLEGHVRQLPLFRELTDGDFARLQDHIELVDFASGEVICEEHDESDCIYVIRSGVVKVFANAGTRLQMSEFDGRDWSQLHTDLAAAGRDDAELAARLVSGSIDEALRAELAQRSDSTEMSGEFNGRLVTALNAFIVAEGIPKELGKTRQEIITIFDDPDFDDALADYPDRCQNWSQLEIRTCRRLILELAFPAGMPRRDESTGPRRTLAYLGRGDSLGEIGVVLDEPRNATCVAYDHPDSGFHQRIPDSRTGAVPSRVELMRIPRDVLSEVMKTSEPLRSSLDAIVERRQKRSQQHAQHAAADPSFLRQQSPRLEQLGLIQGQQLMLIDLDRCTRCGACVDACVVATRTTWCR